MAEPLDFEAFCLGHHTVLLRLLTLYCGDVEVARDLTQETLARAWVHWRKVGRMDRPDLWLRRVALNLANSHFRHRKVERSAPHRPGPQDPTARVDGPGGSTADRLVVREALARLSDRQRTAIVLRYLDDLSVEQTAQLMGCSPGTVKKLAARGLTTLRGLIGEDIEVTSGT
jgi:RNA polymerase sigma-70 factor (sigma-E family)